MKFLNNITLDKLSRLIGKRFQLNTDKIYNKYYHNGTPLFIIGPTNYISICHSELLVDKSTSFQIRTIQYLILLF